MSYKIAPFIVALLAFSCSSSTGTDDSSIPSNEEIAHAALEEKCPEKPLNVAIIIADGVFNTELTAPMDIFQHTQYRCENGMNVYTVSQDGFIVRTAEGLNIIPDFSYYTDSMPSFDVLVIPAAENHLDDALENDSLIEMIRTLGTSANYVVSLCDGAFPLAKSGLMEGLNTTTFPGDQDKLETMFNGIKVHRKVSFVRDGKFITSVGGAKSFDACLYLVEELYGRGGAVKTAEGMVIDWDLSRLNYLEF